MTLVGLPSEGGFHDPVLGHGPVTRPQHRLGGIPGVGFLQAPPTVEVLDGPGLQENRGPLHTFVCFFAFFWLRKLPEYIAIHFFFGPSFRKPAQKTSSG